MDAGIMAYRHILLKEIYEQPRAVMDTLRERIEDTDRLLDELGIGHGVNNLRRLHIVGNGASYHAGLVGRYIIEKFVRIPVNVDLSSEYQYMNPNITKGTYFIALSQSGETPDTIGAQREARKKGALVFSVCNVAGSASAREADSVLYTYAGREKGATSTKGFSAQLAALCLLGIALGVKKGTLHKIEVETLKALIMTLPALISEVLRNDTKIRDIAGTLANSGGVIYLGRGINYPIAREGALKMKELSFIHAEGYAIGQLNFGHSKVVGRDAPVVFLSPIESIDDRMLNDIAKVKAVGGRVIVITDSPASISGMADHLIIVPSIHPALLPFVTVVPLQLLAYHVADVKGCDMDRPGAAAETEMDAYGVHASDGAFR